MNAILKTILLPFILLAFYPDGSWLSELRNLDAFVENDKLYLNEAGADPDVFEFTTATTDFTQGMGQRVDTGYDLTLKSYTTEATIVTKLEETLTNYEKLKSIGTQHGSAMGAYYSRLAAFSVSPASNTANTPVLATTGANSDNGKKMTYFDILKLKLAFDKLNLPATGRVLVLSPEHQTDLLEEDVARYNQVMTLGTLAGFRVYVFNGNATYSTAGVKNAFGAVGQISSFAFYNQEAYRAFGGIDTLTEEAPVTKGGTMLRVETRFLSGVLRGKGVAAIYSDENAE
jgi:hypothetical protein